MLEALPGPAATAGDGEETTRAPPKAGRGLSQPQTFLPLHHTSWGGWQPCELSAEVATMSLKPVAWCWCSPDEEVPRRHPAVRSPCVGPRLGCAAVSSACVRGVRTFPMSNSGGC